MPIKVLPDLNSLHQVLANCELPTGFQYLTPLKEYVSVIKQSDDGSIEVRIDKECRTALFINGKRSPGFRHPEWLRECRNIDEATLGHFLRLIDDYKLCPGIQRPDLITEAKRLKSMNKISSYYKV